jgi:hypothetical protein
VGISGWSEQTTAQADLFEPADHQAQDQKILQTIDTVTEKFGKPLLGVGLSRKKP